MKGKKLSVFNRSWIFDRIFTIFMWLFLVTCLLVPVIDKLILAAIYLWSFVFFFLLYYFSPALRKRFVSTEKIYEGKFDELLKELYGLGLELQAKMGKRYVFGIKYIVMLSKCYLVEDCSKYCTIRANSRHMYFLEKHLNLREKLC